MPPLPALTAKQLLRILKRHGFEQVRQKGSHAIIQHPDGRSTVVPLHAGRTIDRGLLKAILRDTHLTAHDLSRK